MYKLKEEGIDVGIDLVSGIAHNKIMVIDKYITITGSFNFTKSADTRNVENVVIIEDQEISDYYLQNWLYRKKENSPDKKVFRKE